MPRGSTISASRGRSLPKMATPPTSSEHVDPDELRQRSFTRNRKGFDPAEVRAHLAKMSDEIRRLQAHESELAAEVGRLGSAQTDRGDLDDTNLAHLIGDETGRVLEAARAAAAEICTKAEESGSRLVREAQERSTEMTTEAQELRLAATSEADELLASARVASDEMIAEARREANELRESAESEARSTRDRANALLGEKTAEAEAEATAIKAAAEAAKEDADAVAERARREADEYATVTRSAADVHADEVRVSADEAAAKIRGDASEQSRQRGEEADAAAEVVIEAAREHGRGMVQEAKEARERMLRDLAERRRTARQQLEALRAGRERMLEAFASARASFDEATDTVTEALPAAREAADEAARMVTDELESELAELDLEVPGADLGAFGPVDDVTAEAVDDATVEDVAVDGTVDDVPLDAVADPAEPAEGDEVADDDEPSHLRLVSSGPGLAAIDDDLGDLNEDEEADDDEEVPKADDIFARLRAEQTPEGGAVVIDLNPEAADVAGASLLDRRDTALAGLERALTRKLKRMLSDHENGALDRARRARKMVTVDLVVGNAASFGEAVNAALTVDLVEAVTTGASFLADEGHGEFVDAGELVGSLTPQIGEWLTTPIRDRLVRVVESADRSASGRDELVSSLRATYREMKNDQLPAIGLDLLTLAFNRGILASATPGTSHCWIVDHGGLPCPDAEDNHLAGPTVAGEEFPTGDVVPPAHPGCRCILAPSSQ